MNRRKFLVVGSFAITEAHSLTQTPAIPRGLVAVEQRKAIAAFSLPDIDGKIVRSGDFLGSVLILRFWATW